MNSNFMSNFLPDSKKPVIKEDKSLAKKIQSFHAGRVATLFPGNVRFDVNDTEFVDLLLDLDQVYDTSHRLNVVLIKYTRSIESKPDFKISINFYIELSKVNVSLGNQALKIYPAGHINHGTA